MSDLKQKLMDKWFDRIDSDTEFVESLITILVQQCEALDNIKKKQPNSVNRNEAADMAVEFNMGAREALAATDETLKRLGIEV